MRYYFLLILLSTSNWLVAHQFDSAEFTIGGDNIELRRFNFRDNNMSLKQALLSRGIKLDKKSQESIRIILYRKGKTLKFDLINDAKSLDHLELKASDAIIVTDLRNHPNKIKQRRIRINQMIEVKATYLEEELRSLVWLQYDYASWKGRASNKPISSFDDLLQLEVKRLQKEGKAKKVVEILELYIDKLFKAGIGKSHPRLKKTKELITLFKDSTKNH